MSDDRYCRACASKLAKAGVDLFGGAATPHEAVNKLKSFAGVDVDAGDKLPNLVCHQCVVNLDFCIQFVDRCRQVQAMAENGVDMGDVRGRLAGRYPYLDAGTVGKARTLNGPSDDGVGNLVGQTFRIVDVAADVQPCPRKPDVAGTPRRASLEPRPILPKLPVPDGSGTSAEEGRLVSFACPSCSRSFARPGALKYHVKNVHGPVVARPEPGPAAPGKPAKKFRCPVAGCGRSYASKMLLVEHERIHTGEKPFACTNCDKRFFRLLDLRKHQVVKICR